MRSCLAWLLKPGQKSKTNATDYSKQVDSNCRAIQERIWVDIFKVFKFSMSKIEINNFKMHYDVLECNSFNAMKSFLDVYCSQIIPASTGKVHIVWEGHNTLQNLHLTFDCMYWSQKLGEDFAKFCGLLRIYELY